MKQIILTGASDGLGLEVAKLCISKGIRVVALSRNKPAIDSVDLVHIPTDLQSAQQVEQAIEAIKKSYPSFDALIHCAGILQIEELHAIDYEKTDALFRVNTIAPMVITMKLMELLRKNAADIVLVASTRSFKVSDEQNAYGSSKWAMRCMIETFQSNLKKTACRVIGFYPGGFKSRIFEKATGKTDSLRGFMEASDVAASLMYTLSLPKSIEVSTIVLNRKG